MSVARIPVRFDGYGVVELPPHVVHALVALRRSSILVSALSPSSTPGAGRKAASRLRLNLIAALGREAAFWLRLHAGVAEWAPSAPKYTIEET